MPSFPRPLLFFAGMAIALVLSAKLLLPYFGPFVFALVMAALIDPVVDRVAARTGLSRGLTVLVVLTISMIVLLTALTAGGLRLAADLKTLLAALPGYADAFSSWLADVDRLLARLESALPLVSRRVAEGGQWASDWLADWALRTAESGAELVLSGVGRLPNVALGLVVASVGTYFLSKDRRVYGRALLPLLPKRWRSPVLQVKDEISKGVLGFVRAQLVLMAMSGGIAVFGLLLAGVPYAWTLGVMAGLLDLVPMVGPTGVLLPCALFFLLGDRVHAGVAVLGLIAIIALARQLVEPRLVGSQLGLHPLAALMAVYAGARLFGAAGFFLGPILLVAVRAMLIPLLPSLKQ